MDSVLNGRSLLPATVVDVHTDGSAQIAIKAGSDANDGAAALLASRAAESVGDGTRNGLSGSGIGVCSQGEGGCGSGGGVRSKSRAGGKGRGR